MSPNLICCILQFDCFIRSTADSCELLLPYGDGDGFETSAILVTLLVRLFSLVSELDNCEICIFYILFRSNLEASMFTDEFLNDILDGVVFCLFLNADLVDLLLSNKCFDFFLLFSPILGVSRSIYFSFC